MRRIFCVIILVLIADLQTGRLHAQAVAYSPVAFTNANISHSELPVLLPSYGYKRHCRAVTIGKVLMITGGAVATVGAVAFATAPNDESGFAQYFLGAIAVAGGGECLLAGGIVFACGKIHDHRHRYSFSIESNRQGIGVACHF